MSVTVYTLGDPHVMRAALEGLAMLFGRGSVFANGASSLGLGPVAGLGLLVTLTAVLVGGVLRQQVNVHHVLLMAVAYGVAFVPTERVVVENLYAMDGGPAAVAPVDGVPIAIAYTAAFASGLSREVTEELETAFSGVDGQESVLTRDGFARPLRLAQGLRQIGQRAGPLLGADYVATLSSYGRYCTHDSNGNSLNYVELGRSAAVLDYLASSPVQGYSQVWDARPPYSAPYPGPSLVRTCRETAQWLRERGVQWLGSQSDDGLAFKLGVAVGAKPDCGSQCRLSPMDVDDALEQAMGNLPLSRAQILQNIVFAPLVMQALKLGSAQSADTAYTIGLQESGARESGPGSMFRGTITYAMNICTFLFVAFAPVMAVVMLLLGLQGIQLLARYLLFGVWVYSWLPGAAIVNAYVQLSMREQLANLAHGTADPMALFTPEALRDFHAQVDAMLGMADTLFTATPMITMMLLTGSLYGMAQLAQRAGGMMAAGMSTSGASEGAAAPQAASGGMSSPALLAPPPMSAGLGGLGGGLAGGGLLAGMSAALARRRGGASAVGASTTGWDEGGGAREADNGSAGSALASGGRVQGGGGALELARQFQRQGHGGSGQSALSAVRGMIGRRASGAEAERLEQQLASSERQAKAMGGGASEALELFAQKLDGALGRGDGGAGARAVLEEMAQAGGHAGALAALKTQQGGEPSSPKGQVAQHTAGSGPLPHRSSRPPEGAKKVHAAKKDAADRKVRRQAQEAAAFAARQVMSYGGGALSAGGSAPQAAPHAAMYGGLARAAQASQAPSSSQDKQDLAKYARLNQQSQQLARQLADPASRSRLAAGLGGEKALSEMVEAYKDDLKSEDVYLHRQSSNPVTQSQIRQMESALAAFGIHRLGANELLSRGLSPSMFEDAKSGFASALYRDEGSGRYTVAFRGTEGETNDMVTDALNAAGVVTSQYSLAANLAVALSMNSEFQGHLSYTGHSLGGGLASMASARTRSPARTFNAAGLHQDVVRQLGGTLQGLKQSVKAYYLDGEILHRAQGSAVADTLVNLLSPLSPQSLGGPGGFADRVPEAAGLQIPLSPWLDEKPVVGTWARLKNSPDLHKNGNVLNTLQKILGGRAARNGQPYAKNH
ncbi:conjugal transfer protein TraG N-terminal domain-containing protein [Chromobacterium sp. IIBBL 290-4]|uniref:conjugal transfer protein TraG N-terminal domain-containing protein n=1 Tax=Chromobacterium sp. IIBBL 290-4 TaxID=2953890 RepID=UPI0020B6CC3E|nr:conjugal transfer protein TraG N-terminal domain-containing protein [Chromobacterium sp. IIBBL 290-4]UTH74229.1 conjugal transfer protein TraG N-terminal domain-containing protein [Chromobacterium sp. IIBBL 290-4]